MSRRSIETETFRHQNPIPSASRVGPLIESSLVVPFSPGTRDLPDTLDAQVENVFAHVEVLLRNAGAGWGDVVKMTFFVADLDARATINGPWLARFPDPDSRPARHTQRVDADGAIQVSCVFTAYIAE